MEYTLETLEQKIQYCFQNKKLLTQSLTHSSYVNDHQLKKSDCNERLEFLGDAVLELVSSEYLYRSHPNIPEGKLTKKRASMVCEQALAYCAGDIELGRYLMLGRGEDNTGGRERPSVTSDAFEALIGAIYLDGGFESASEFIHRFVLNDLENKQLFYDSKTILQELVQAEYTEPLRYELIKEEGPDHNKSFEVAVKIGDKIYATATGRTKKAAEQNGAYKTILSIKKQQ